MVLAATKALKKAEMLKERMLGIKDLFVDNEPWILQQQMQRLYRRVLLLDLEYALDKKVEQDLWNYTLKNIIAILQGVTKDKKHPKRSEGLALLSGCLEAASGFYISLLQEICSVFDVDLVFRRRDSTFGSLSPIPKPPQECKPSKNSCFYISQHCLVHLGDIARYRNQNRQAETFYRYAVSLAPGSGQPYNQLAILEASRGDKLSAVYHYVRAMALKHPFPAAATNLSRALDRHAEDPVKLSANCKLSSYEYLAVFLKLHGLLHTHTELETASRMVQALTTSLTAHIATESLSAWKLVQIVAINIFLLERVKGTDDPDITGGELTDEELQVRNLITHYLAGCLNAFLLPVYTIKSDDSLLNYFAMPAIKLTLEWIRLQPEVLDTSAFQSRLQIWPSLCRLLNEIQSGLAQFPRNKYQDVPLPEDRDLQAFLPLEKAFKGLKFQTDDLKKDMAVLSQLRAYRMVAIGSWLADLTEPRLISSSPAKEGSAIVFEPVGRLPPTGDILRELKELSLGDLISPKSTTLTGPLSETCVSGSNAVVLATSVCKPIKESAAEKRPGILKNEVEKGETRVGTNKGSRNVALATIMNQKLAEDTKPAKVTFRTPSPAAKDKVPKASPKRKQNKVNSEDKVAKHLKDKGPSKDKILHNSKGNVDTMLLQQQKLMDVLVKDAPALADEGKKIVNKEQPKSKGKDVEKQLVLSALFNDSRSSEQPQAVSGLLNLNKQQQEILTNSKHGPPRQQQNQQLNSKPMNNAQGHGHQKVVDKIEAARKEYEDAMFVLQQRKQEQSELNRFSGDRDQFNYERIIGGPPPAPPTIPPPTVFMAMNPPILGLQPFAFKYQQGMVLPFREPEQPPMPPASWWADRPPPPPVSMIQDGYGEYREGMSFTQPPLQQLNTYSLFSNPVGGDADPNYHMAGRIMPQQSFWSGPGPSPLERLLEQQRKQLRDKQPNT